MNVSLVNDTLCVALTWYRTLIFSAAQPGVGRVQVLGSKKSLEDEELLGIKSFPQCPKPGVPLSPAQGYTRGS